MIILIGGEKGGSGKSCLAQNITVALMNRGRDVLLLDADPQGTTTDWTKEREQNENLTNVLSVQASGDIRNTLKELSKRYTDIVIDAGGQDSEALRSAMTIASHMLLPFRPKRRDLKTLVNVEQMVKLARAVNPELITKAVITQCPALPSQVQRILDAKETCQSFGLSPLNAITVSRNVYDDADEDGYTVFEIGSDSKAAAEINAVTTEFLEV